MDASVSNEVSLSITLRYIIPCCSIILPQAAGQPAYDSIGKGQFSLALEFLKRTGCPSMPKLTVEDVGTFEVPEGKRLVLALEDEAKIDQLHACGGNARCTTCRVEFVDGQPEQMTEAEQAVMRLRGLTENPALRLSCQIKCDRDMTVRAISRLAGSGRPNVGQRPADDIAPPPQWTQR
jgi:ferredoxin